jgi:oxygen-dependent protoporphyrinogen oxidase
MHTIVIGGGISGLAAAHRLLGSGVRVTVVEGSRRWGGKLRSGEIAGIRADLGAESMLARRPEGVELARAVGLGGALRPPAVAGAAIWTRGSLRPMPQGHLLGVPGTPAALAGVLSDAGVARIARDAELPPTELGEDAALGRYVAERMGAEVVDRLVEPLLGGVYAGDAYRLSMRATVPGLFQAAQREPSLLAAVREAQTAAAPARPGEPPFTGLDGGLGTLPDAVADSCRAQGGTLLRDASVTGLRRTPAGWAVTLDDGRLLTGSAVLLAVPAAPAARLLHSLAPAAARELAGVEYASMALVTLAFRRCDLARLPRGSGFLVPAVDGRDIKAATFSTSKWDWVAAQDPGLFVLRTSLGRYTPDGADRTLEREDAELVELSLADLREAAGLTARPSTRWSPAGPTGCRSTRSAMSPGWPGSGRRSPRCPDCGCAARPTTGSASRPAWPARTGRRASCWPPCRRCRTATRDNSRMSAAPEKSPNAGKKAKDLNEVIRYTLWSVFRLRDVLPEDRAGYADEVEELFKELADADVTVRGTYDVSGLRADADVLIWWHSATSEALQNAYNRFRRTRFGRTLEPVWSNMALHRPAEFNKAHIPAFLADENPRDYVSVYPFVRSYDWYLLPDEDRRRMLADHGKMARGYPDVRANTVASFSLGDYEWILAFEADELHRIVDLMRLLRASEARLHVREEVPFYTGRRKPVAELIGDLA